MRGADEGRARRPHEEDLLQHVEGDGRDGQELRGVGGGEADVGGREGGEVLGAEGEVFHLLKGKGVSFSGYMREAMAMGVEHTAQMPRQMRFSQGLWGLGGTDLMVSPMRRMTLSASLSSCVILETRFSL